MADERSQSPGSFAAEPDRRRLRQRRWLAWGALVALSLSLHLWALDARSFHHDESIHARLSYDLLHEGVYRYDPTYHGPLLYYLTAATFAVAGDSNFTARLPIALAGVLMLWVAWTLRRPFGDRAAWWTGLLFTISPIMLFYGRFLRMDMLEMVTASAALAAWYRVLRGSRTAWLWLGLWTALAFATKENAYVTAALVGVAGGAVALTSGPWTSVKASWTWARREWLGLAAALAVFVLVTIPLYTVGFSHPQDWAFPVKAISYWWHQHSIHRVSGPCWYHLPRLAQYEFLAIGAALVWIVRRIRKLKRIEIFLIVFAVASVGTYCYLGEKTPWLAVHQVWAFVPLAGAQLARTFGKRGRWWSRGVAGAALLATVAASLCASFVLDEITPARDRVESLIFVQTCPEVKQVAADGLAVAAAQKSGLVAAVSGEASWPLMWYWRRLQIWWGTPSQGSRPPIVICDPGREAEVRKAVGPGYSRRRIPLRAWWLMYQEVPTAKEVLRYLLTRKPWGDLGSTDVVVLRREKGGTKPQIEVELPRSLASSLRVVRATVVGSGWLGEPRGLSLQGKRLAIADAALGRLFVSSDAGVLREVPVQTPLNQPEALAWAGLNALYVADTWNHRVLRVDVGDGTFTTFPTPKGGWYGPRSVAVAPDGWVAVTDTGNKRVVLYDPASGGLSAIGGEGSAPGKFVEPGGIAWLDSSSFVVCDTGNRRVQALDRTGRVRSVVSLPDAWSDFYSRPQIAVIAPDEWIATDTPGQALWHYHNGKVTRIDLGGAGIRPTGIAWDPASRRLAVGDLSGKVWVMEVSRV